MIKTFALSFVLLATAFLVFTVASENGSYDVKPTTMISKFPLNFWQTAVTVVVGLIALDQLNYRLKKRHLPGPSWIPPVVGKLWDSVNPDFRKYKASWDSGKLSCTSVFQHFIVIASDTELSRKIFNFPSNLTIAVVPAMTHILKPNNFVFLQGEPHATYRKQLNPLFTRKALSLYLPHQQDIYKQFANQWLATGSTPHEFYNYSRNLTMATSLRVFCGEYMPIDVVQEISDKYKYITQSLQLVNFPFPFPGTKVYNAIQARKYIVKAIQDCAKLSQERMAKGEEPNCLLDNWIQNINAEAEKYKANSEGPAPKIYSCEEIAMVVMTFLFASQDASTSSLTWLMQLMADHPDVLEKVRQEQLRLRPNLDVPFSLDILDQMEYTKQVVKETLRYRPPVIMVPYKAKKDTNLDGTYTIPKGSLIIPSVWPALHDPKVWENPDTFDPDRMGPARQEDQKATKNWLVFGHGPHICLGKEYAVNHLVAFLATVSVLLDWKHHITPESENIKIISTIFPADDCLLSFNKYTPVC